MCARRWEYLTTPTPPHVWLLSCLASLHQVRRVPINRHVGWCAWCTCWLCDAMHVAPAHMPRVHVPCALPSGDTSVTLGLAKVMQSGALGKFKIDNTGLVTAL